MDRGKVASVEAALSMPRYDFASLILKTYIQCVAVCDVLVGWTSLTHVLRLQVPVAAPCRYPLQLLRSVPPCTGAEALVVAGMLVDLVRCTRPPAVVHCNGNRIEVSHYFLRI